jgi:hypothetical protein
MAAQSYPGQGMPQPGRPGCGTSGRLYGPFKTSEKVAVRKTAIWPRVTGLLGQ